MRKATPVLCRIFLTPIPAVLPVAAAVRYGRVPKRSRERGGGGSSGLSDEGLSSLGSPGGEAAEQCARDLESQQLAMYDIILTISQAHHAHCAYTEEKTRALVRRPAIFVSALSLPRASCLFKVI